MLDSNTFLWKHVFLLQIVQKKFSLCFTTDTLMAEFIRLTVEKTDINVQPVAWCDTVSPAGYFISRLSHKSTPEPEAGEQRGRNKERAREESGRNKRDGGKYWAERHRVREGMQWECGELLLSKPHPSPAKPPFFPSLCSLAEIYLFWDYFSSVNSSLTTWWMIKWLHRGSAAH